MEGIIKQQTQAAANRLLVARRDGVEASAIAAIMAQAKQMPPLWRQAFLDGVAYSCFLPSGYVEGYKTRMTGGK